GSSLHTLRVNGGANIYWANNILHGGPISIGPLALKGSAPADQWVDTVVVENNQFSEANGLWCAQPRLSVNPGSGNVMVRNNIFAAPDLHTGPYATAAVRVTDSNDLSSFTTLASGGGVDGNVWCLPAGSYSRGVNYVSNAAAGAAAYRTPAEWSADFPAEVE